MNAWNYNMYMHTNCDYCLHMCLWEWQVLLTKPVLLQPTHPSSLCGFLKPCLSHCLSSQLLLQPDTWRGWHRVILTHTVLSSHLICTSVQDHIATCQSTLLLSTLSTKYNACLAVTLQRLLHSPLCKSMHPALNDHTVLSNWSHAGCDQAYTCLSCNIIM